MEKRENSRDSNERTMASQILHVNAGLEVNSSELLTFIIMQKALKTPIDTEKNRASVSFIFSTFNLVNLFLKLNSLKVAFFKSIIDQEIRYMDKEASPESQLKSLETGIYDEARNAMNLHSLGFDVPAMRRLWRSVQATIDEKIFPDLADIASKHMISYLIIEQASQIYNFSLIIKESYIEESKKIQPSTSKVILI